jgi:hypothetical protein
MLISETGIAGRYQACSPVLQEDENHQNHEPKRDKQGLDQFEQRPSDELLVAEDDVLMSSELGGRPLEWR